MLTENHFYLKQVFCVMVPIYHKAYLFFKNNSAKHIIQMITQLITLYKASTILILQGLHFKKVYKAQQKSALAYDKVQSRCFYFEDI